MAEYSSLFRNLQQTLGTRSIMISFLNTWKTSKASECLILVVASVSGQPPKGKTNESLLWSQTGNGSHSRPRTVPTSNSSGSLDQIESFEDAVWCHSLPQCLEYVEDRKDVLSRNSPVSWNQEDCLYRQAQWGCRVPADRRFENDPQKALDLLAGQDLENSLHGFGTGLI